MSSSAVSMIVSNSQLAASDVTEPPIVIIGNGVTGMHAARELLRRKPTQPLVIFGEEPCQPYNRLKLSSLLAGKMDLAGVTTELAVNESSKVEQRHGYAITRIDPAWRMVTDSSGKVLLYRKLILAMGSLPHHQNIAGNTLNGVFNFHTLSDAEKLIARRMRSRRTLIIGGGLLGLEAACGMQQAHTEVVIVDHADRLLNRQLDVEGSKRLLDYIESLGIGVLLNSAVKKITGDDRVTGVVLYNGHTIACDTVIIAIGTLPNAGLAKASGIKTGKGIKVNDVMQTSVPDIYAIGECAEHHDQVHGLVEPGLEQAEIAVDHLCGGSSTYQGFVESTTLKALGVNVFSVGPMAEPAPSPLVKNHTYSSASIYRSIQVRRFRLLGAVAVGDWQEQNRVLEWVSKGRWIMPWQIWRFRNTGLLWRPQKR